MENINEINAKILKDLLIDGRKSFTLIAKEAGVSKDIIWQHYKKMQKKKVVVGATAQLHYASLGYHTVATFYVNFKPGKEKQVLESVARLPRIFSAGSMNNNSEIAVVATMRNNHEMDHIIQKIKGLPSVLSLSTIVWLGLRSITDNLSVLSVNEETSEANAGIHDENIIVKKSLSKLDETDQQIIEKISVNGRASFRKIANDLKISTDTVTRRYKNLKQHGVIKTVIQINPKKLGYTAEAFIDLSYVAQQNGPHIIDILTKIPDVIKIIKTSGNFDLRLFVFVKSLEHLFKIQNKIANIENVTNIKITIQKIPHIWPVPRENTSTF